MSDRPDLEYLAQLLAENPGKPVVLTSQKGWRVSVRRIYDDGYAIRVVIQVNN